MFLPAVLLLIHPGSLPMLLSKPQFCLCLLDRQIIAYWSWRWEAKQVHVCSSDSHAVSSSSSPLAESVPLSSLRFHVWFWPFNRTSFFSVELTTGCDKKKNNNSTGSVTVEKILKVAAFLRKLGSTEINFASASTQSAARWRSKLIKMALCGTMQAISGQAPQGYSSCIVGRLTGASRGIPATAICSWVRTHNRIVPFFLLVKVPLQLLSKSDLLSALLCDTVKRRGDSSQQVGSWCWKRTKEGGFSLRQ